MVRRVEPVSVLRVAGLFWLSMFVVLIIAGVLLWLAGDSVGALSGVTKFMQSVGFDNFRLHGGPLLRASLAGGMVMVLVATLLSVLAAVLFNLISDVMGGVRVWVAATGEAGVPVGGVTGSVGGSDAVGRPAARPSAERRRETKSRGRAGRKGRFGNEGGPDGRVSSARPGL